MAPTLSRRSLLAGGSVGVAAAGAAAFFRPKGKGRRDAAMRIAYGAGPMQVGDLWLPTGPRSEAEAEGTVVLLHGGFWLPGYDRGLMTPLARDLTGRGYVVWNVDYRPVENRSGWPYLFEDVAAGIDHLATLAGEYPVAPGRVVVVGHSAGGQLALWSAARAKLGAGLPGADPKVRPRAVVGQAALADLVAAAEARTGGRAVPNLVGGLPAEVPERYAAVSPVALVPTGVRTLLVHGADDDIVPVSQSRAYAEAARTAGDPVELVEIAGADHFAVIDPQHRAWTAVTDRLSGLLV